MGVPSLYWAGVCSISRKAQQQQEELMSWQLHEMVRGLRGIVADLALLIDLPTPLLPLTTQSSHVLSSACVDSKSSR